MTKDLKVGILGCGGFMGRSHGNGWNQLPVFFYPPPANPIKAVACDIVKPKVDEYIHQWGWKKAMTDYKQMIKKGEIDILDNVTPNDMHLEPTLMAADAGIHIICEKPLAKNLDEAKQMAAAVKKAGVKAMCAYNYRRVPAVQLAKKLIDDGMIGRIFHWRAVYLQDWITDPNFPLVWRLQAEKAGSGPHGDLNAHIIDLSQFLLGDISQVCGMEETFIKERPLPSGEGVGLGDHTANNTEKKMGKVTVDDAVLFLAKFANGALGSFEATRFATGRRNYNCFEINGSKGSIVFNLERMNELQFYSNEDPKFAQGFRTINVTEGVHPYVNKFWPSGHIIGWEHTFTFEFYDFLDAIVNNKPIHADFDDAIKDQIVLEQVKKSIQTKTWEKC
jgi:predicted dehydrogenase